MLVFDASTGRVLLSQHMLRVLQSSPVHTLSTASRATSSTAQRMLQLLAGQVGQPECGSGRTLQFTQGCVSDAVLLCGVF